VPAFAVVIRVEERRPPIASAWQFWRHPAGGPAPVVVLLEAEAPHATLLAGALAGGAASIDLAGASGAKARLDRVLSSLAEDFALVQSDRVAWVDAEAPRALLRAASAPGVAIATALLASDGERVIHAGYTLGAGGAGLFGNVLEGWNASEPPPAPFDTPVYDVAACSRLALAVRRTDWREGQPAGECNLEFAIVEQGLALTQDGGRVVVCTEARAVLLPPAGIPVDTPTTPAMRTDFLRRWSPRIANDPFHSPRLSLDPPWREESRFAKWRGDPQVVPRVVVLPPVSDSPEASRVRESLSSLAAAGRAAVMVPEDASRPVTIAQVVRLVPRVVVMQEPFDEARLATWQDLAGLGFARRVLLADPRSGDWKALAALKRAASLATRVVVADESLGRALHGSCPDIRVLPGFAPDPRAWTQAILD